jgi:hypothetical protein
MSRILNWIRKRTSIEHKAADGLELALETVETLKDRSFSFLGPGMKYKAIPDTEIARFVKDELPEYYNYRTDVTTYSDRRKVKQADICITGWIGIRGQYRRPSPLDRNFIIKTEAPKPVTA